ncbi:Calcium-transporting ATPase 2, plasma membrane-type [Linum perenne]
MCLCVFQEKLRIAVLVSKAAFQFINSVPPSDYSLPPEVKAEGHDVKKLRFHGGVSGIAQKLCTSTNDGLPKINKFAESESRGFWVFVWEALHDMTLMILAVCAFVSLIVGIATEGWPKGAHDGLGIVASIMLVVFVTATSDYRQSLQFKDLDKEKKKISIQVTRNGFRQKMSIYDLLPGDIVHLAIGDQVPADGLFVSGFSVLIDESSLTGESEPVMVTADHPFLLSGTKVQDGSCKMMITTVGMRTQWGKLMATLSEGGDDETPLQVKLNGVATIIGKIGLFFAVITFAVLVQGLLRQKLKDGSHMDWNADEALEMLEYFAIAVTIVVVSLAFAMKKMMNDKALVRHLAACETMGSATTICIGNPSKFSSLRSQLHDSALKILLQSIFNNTGGEVVMSKERKREILGTPTEAAILEFGLSLGGEFQGEREAVKLVKLEPFNSTKKRMSAVVELPGGGLRAHSKGASEIVLASCDKVIDSKGEAVALDDSSLNFLNTTIDQFAGEALRTLCLAYKEVQGIVGIKDPVRPGVKESVAVCHAAGIAVRMVTGDNINTAKAIARECGILTDGGIAIEGPVFREKSQAELLELIPKIQVMARSSPLDKHTLVRHLRTTFDDVVAVTGDGTNDAPALHEADIGLAMGIAGTEVKGKSGIQSRLV